MRALVLLISIPVLALSLTLATAAQASSIAGRAIVTDGDTIVVDDVSVRLEGIDAPETDQLCLDERGQRYACGIRAKSALVRLIADRAVSCDVTGKDSYGRSLARCVAGADNLNGRMVEEGWALAFVRYSSAYVETERKARDRAAGLWAGAFIAPWEWRSRTETTTILGALVVPVDAYRRLWAPGAGESPPVAGCSIKGNIDRNGERVYHVIGTQDYGRTRIDPKRGERWFCTEAEARAAGWRRAAR